MPHYEVIFEFDVLFRPHRLLGNPVTLNITPYSAADQLSHKQEEGGERCEKKKPRIPPRLEPPPSTNHTRDLKNSIPLKRRL